MWALVPIKSFRTAKSRLSPMMSPAVREALARAMAADVLDVLTRCRKFAHVAVCSADPEVLAFGRQRGCLGIAETVVPQGLNAAIARAADHLRRAGAGHMMVVHGDLPLLSGEDVAAFVTAYSRATDDVLAITPDRHDDGSNLVMWPLGSGFTGSYGPNSFARHLDQAQACGLRPLVCRLPGAEWDVDRMEDLSPLITGAWGTWGSCGPATRRVLQSLRPQRARPIDHLMGALA